MNDPKLTTHSDGTKEWRLNGKRHREDGPAVEYANGEKRWCINGKLHRVDGPAIEYVNGYKSWYLNDIWYPEQEWREEIFKINLREILG